MTSSFVDEVAAARPVVTAVVARLIGDEAEDVVQEAVLRAFLALSQLRERERFESWLCGIALNIAKTRLRRAATERRLLATLGAVAERPETDPLGYVLEAVELLPPGQREAVLLHYIDGLSCEEVAAALGSTPAAVRVRLHRARAELRRQLVPEPPVTLKRKETVMVELALEDVIVRVDSEDATKLVSEMRIVVLREKDGERRLPIWIGPGEGNALAVRLHKTDTVRPLTYDLITELIRTLGGSVERAEITRLESDTFYASLVVDGQELDARPSDAINVAVRTGAPIVAAPEVLDMAGVVGDPELATKLDTPKPGVEVPSGAWRSLSSDLLPTLYRKPT
jgi:RNA polymerase sigma factor (sigma-70 family)